MASEWIGLFGVALGSGMTGVITWWQARRADRTERSRQQFEATLRASEGLRQERLAIHSQFVQLVDAEMGVRHTRKAGDAHPTAAPPEWYGSGEPGIHPGLAQLSTSLEGLASRMRLICDPKVVEAAWDLASAIREASHLDDYSASYGDCLTARDRYVVLAGVELGARNS